MPLPLALLPVLAGMARGTTIPKERREQAKEQSSAISDILRGTAATHGVRPPTTQPIPGQLPPTKLPEVGQQPTGQVQQQQIEEVTPTGQPRISFAGQPGQPGQPQVVKVDKGNLEEIASQLPEYEAQQLRAYVSNDVPMDVDITVDPAKGTYKYKMSLDTESILTARKSMAANIADRVYSENVQTMGVDKAKLLANRIAFDSVGLAPDAAMQKQIFEELTTEQKESEAFKFIMDQMLIVESNWIESSIVADQHPYLGGLGTVALKNIRERVAETLFNLYMSQDEALEARVRLDHPGLTEEFLYLGKRPAALRQVYEDVGWLPPEMMEKLEEGEPQTIGDYEDKEFADYLYRTGLDTHTVLPPTMRDAAHKLYLDEKRGIKHKDVLAAKQAQIEADRLQPTTLEHIGNEGVRGILSGKDYGYSPGEEINPRHITQATNEWYGQEYTRSIQLHYGKQKINEKVASEQLIRPMKELVDMSQMINTAAGGPARIWHGMRLSGMAWWQGGGDTTFYYRDSSGRMYSAFDENIPEGAQIIEVDLGAQAAVFNDMRVSFLARFARAFGERGVLNEGDIKRAEKLLPTLFSSEAVASRKLGMLIDFIFEVNSREDSVGTLDRMSAQKFAQDYSSSVFSKDALQQDIDLGGSAYKDMTADEIYKDIKAKSTKLFGR